MSGCFLVVFPDSFSKSIVTQVAQAHITRKQLGVSEIGHDPSMKAILGYMAASSKFKRFIKLCMVKK